VQQGAPLGPAFTEFFSMRIEVVLLLVLAIVAFVLGVVSLVLIRLFRGLGEAPVYRLLLAEELPQAARRFFDERTARLGRLGFRRCGDYRLRQEIEHYARLHLDPASWRTCASGSGNAGA
jgi:hypothetical protein